MHHSPQAANRVGRGELLAAEARDEAPAADFAARLHAPVDAHELAPWRQARFALQHRAEHDAVTLEERLRHDLDVVRALGSKERPTPRRFHQVSSLVGWREKRRRSEENTPELKSRFGIS